MNRVKVIHGKIYEYTASKIYHKHIDKINKDERFVGKTATLALGYQGGKRAFVAMAENYGVEISEKQGEKIKNDWRSANNFIVKFWHRIEQVAKNAVAKPGKATQYRNIGFKVISNFLYCKLPSGRCLAYYRPKLVPTVHQTKGEDFRVVMKV